MSRTTKIILGVIAGLSLICIVVCGVAFFAARRWATNFSESVTDPTKIAGVGQHIADYQLPEGYEQWGMNLVMYEMVMINPEDATEGYMSYTLMQFPFTGEQSTDEMRDQMYRTYTQQSGTTNAKIEILGNYPCTIRGQEIELIDMLTTSSGFSLRQMYGYFEGKGGLAMIMIQSTPEQWDQEHVDAFLGTFK